MNPSVRRWQRVSGSRLAMGLLLLAMSSPALATYTVSKSFSPASVPAGGASTLTIQVTNSPTGGGQVDAFVVEDTYPSGLFNLSTATTNGNCGTPTLTASVGGSSLVVSGGEVKGNKTCLITLSVTANVAGTYDNDAKFTIDYQSKGRVTRHTEWRDATLTVTGLVATTAAKSFSPSTIVTGASSTLSITITNPNAATLNNLAFTDTFPDNLLVASTPALSNTCGGSATASADGSALSLSGGSLAANASCTVRVAVTSNVPGSYTNNSGPIDTSNAPDGASASAVLTVQAAVDSFDAAEVGTGPVNARLFTKLVGTGFQFDLLALDTFDAEATTFTGTVGVELVDGSGSDCAGATLIRTLANQTFIDSDAGRKTVSVSAEASAWRNVRVRATYSGGSSSVVACSSDAFAIRPTTFAVSSTASADSTGSDATQTPTFAAGTTFALYANGGSGYVGTPEFDASITPEAHAGAARVGTLSGSFAAAVSGSATGSFSYDEVGYVRLRPNTVFDDDFTLVDQADGDCLDSFGDTPVGGRYGCKFGNAVTSDYFGRFIPDHFVVAITDGCTVSSGDDYTYAGQPFTVGVGARNASGGTTQNYQPGFSRDVTLTSTEAAIGSIRTGTDTVAATAFAKGVASSATVKFDFATSPTLPTEVKIRATDSEGVSSNSPVEGEVSLRSGRLRLLNAFGRATQPLLMPMRIEYWRDFDPPNELGGWDLATTDACTTLLSSQFGFSGVSTSVDSVEPFNAGKGTLVLTPPGAGSAGDTTVTANLTGEPDWLRFEWDGDTSSTPDNPSARASWELNPGNQSQIYRREVIQP